MSRCRVSEAGGADCRAPLKELGRRTLTNLYNERPQWLADAHAKLDATVAEAYGWEAETSADHALHKLLELNLRIPTDN